MVAGSARGRLLTTPSGRTTRPTSDRVREAIFNALHSLGALEGAAVLDAFAGSGSLGVEALSRGAASVVFAEPDREARAAVTANVGVIGADDATVVHAVPAERVLDDARKAGMRFDLVLLDPPYAFDGWADLLGAVADVLTDHAVVVAESGRPIAVGPRLHITRQKRYGSTVVTFARPSGAAS